MAETENTGSGRKPEWPDGAAGTPDSGASPREVGMTQMLKPCPFCGSEPHWSPTYIDTDDVGTVACSGCDSSVIVGGSKADRIAHWNTRASSIPEPEAASSDEDAVKGNDNAE